MIIRKEETEIRLTVQDKDTGDDISLLKLGRTWHISFTHNGNGMYYQSFALLTADKDEAIKSGIETVTAHLKRMTEAFNKLAKEL